MVRFQIGSNTQGRWGVLLIGMMEMKRKGKIAVRLAPMMGAAVQMIVNQKRGRGSFQIVIATLNIDESSFSDSEVTGVSALQVSLSGSD